jgi:hypothetical protein
MNNIKTKIQEASSNILRKLEYILAEQGAEIPKTKIGNDEIIFGEGKTDLLFTGGAAVSMLLEELGWKNFQEEHEVIYNDFDFFYVKENVTSRDCDYSINQRKNQTAEVYDGYGRFSHIGKSTKYYIIDTEHDGPVNLTSIGFVEEVCSDQSCFYEVLTKFDINATQFGISINTGEVFFTEEFLNFLETGQLRAVDFETPHHTAVRLIKKAVEHGFYFDERELLKLSYFISYETKYFGEKYFKLFKKYAGILNNYFDLKCIFFSDVEQNFDLYELVINNNTRLKLEEVGIGNLERILGRGTDYITSKALDTLIFESPKKRNALEKKVEELLPEFKEAGGNYRVSEALISISLVLYNTNKDFMDVKKEYIRKLFNMFLNHNNVLRFFINIKDFDKVIEFINFFLKKEKTVGTYIWGVVETSSELFQTEEEFEKVLFDYQKEINRPLKEPLFEKTYYNNYSYEELFTGLMLKEEGEKMHHCVGGYNNAVETGRSIIISIKNYNDNIFATAEFRTINLVNNKTSETEVFYRLVQLRGKRNCSIEESIKNTIFDGLKTINKRFLTEEDYSKLISDNYFKRVEAPRPVNGRYDVHIDNEDEIPF